MDTIGIVSTVKAPISQLYLFVNYHLNIGVDHIFLFFDDPEDIGISSFSRYGQVTTIGCSTEYWDKRSGSRPVSIEERQSVNVNQGAEYLSLKSCKWLIHIDCDELINASRPLNELLSNFNVDVVRFTVLEAVAEQEICKNIFVPSLFKKQGHKEIIYLAKKIGWFQAFFDGEYFRGHSASKAAVRIAPKLMGKYGIHGPKESPNITIRKTDSIELLHFDCVSIDEWKLKWDRRIDGSGLALQMRENRRKQMRLYENAKSEGDNSLSLLFKKMHGIRKIERPILFFLRLLKRIKIDKRLFASPNNKATK